MQGRRSANRIFHLALAAALALAGPFWARPAGAQDAPPRCLGNALGDVSCARSPEGVAVLSDLGRVLCAPGRCLRVEETRETTEWDDDWACASRAGGGVRVTPEGPECDGGCRSPTEADCELQ